MLVIIFQSVVGVRVRGDDSTGTRILNGLAVVVTKGHKEQLFAEAPDFMAAVTLGWTQDSEILANMVKNSRGRPGDGLHAVIERSDTVDEVQRICAGLLVEALDGAS